MREFAIQRPRGIPGPFSSLEQGFTLTELVVAIVIVGILAAVLLPRFNGRTGFEERGLRDETLAALRYAQKSAIAARRLVCLSFTPNSVGARMESGFGLADCAAGPVLNGPAGTPLAVVATGGALFSAQPGNALTFDALGRPSARTVISVQGLPATLGIVVEAETGYVH